jgi:PadR family transcriptional regulator, regulatory protein AphA
MTILMYQREGFRHSIVTAAASDPGPARSPAAIKLTPTSYLMLGMVRLGISSGYAIKKAADGSTQNFWPTSLAQVYPELARLERAGLLDRRDDPQGGRNRSAYTITESGEIALRAWLSSPKLVPAQMRDEGLLRLFFADALKSEDQVKLVRMLRERNQGLVEELRVEIIPRAEAFASQGGPRFVAISARFLADFMAYAEGWAAQLEAQLEAESN